MSKRECIQIVSRAVALILVFWSLLWFAMIPAHFHSLFHYRAIFPRTAQQDYIYTNDLIVLLAYIANSGGLFIAAIWVSRCGPTIQKFLSPSEE